MLFIISCNDESETTLDLKLPHITVYGKKEDTVAYNSFYNDEKAEAEGCKPVIITGSVNTSKPGTYYIHYDYTDSSGRHAATETRTVHVILSRNDSAKIKETYSLCQNITISKHWKAKDKILNEINLDISLQPIINLYHAFGNSINLYKITDVKNHTDSIVFTTTTQISDTTFLWTFRPINKTKGTWSILNKQNNRYKKLGAFLSADK